LNQASVEENAGFQPRGCVPGGCLYWWLALLVAGSAGGCVYWRL